MFQMISIFINAFIAICSSITLLFSIKYNKATLFSQLLNAALCDKRFNKICMKIEYYYKIKNSSNEIDYFLSVIKELISINEKKTICHFNRELFFLSYHDEMFNYIEMNSDLTGTIMMNDIYTNIYKVLLKIRKKQCKNNYVFNLSKYVSYKKTNLYIAMNCYNNGKSK